MTWKTTALFTITAALAASMLSGCAAFNKTRPHDLTVRGHEAAAAAEEGKAAKAAEDAKKVGRGAQYAHYMAPRHRELADAHRAAARALTDEEVKACEGVPAAAAGAAIAGARIASVDEIRQGTVPTVVHSGKGYYPQYLQGAKLTLAGATNSADVERLLGCRIARAAAEGDDGVDPLAVKGTSVKVTAPGDAMVLVEIRAEDQPAAAEVVRRARVLAAR
ncbi:MAG: hypothetical protein NDI82_07870 [Anaeromyxobacteraceae bacterium]|nr:hypothetical protein [Anaeromyxobacteraceae bacterium]